MTMMSDYQREFLREQEEMLRAMSGRGGAVAAAAASASADADYFAKSKSSSAHDETENGDATMILADLSEECSSEGGEGVKAVPAPVGNGGGGGGCGGGCGGGKKRKRLLCAALALGVVLIVGVAMVLSADQAKQRGGDASNAATTTATDADETDVAEEDTTNTVPTATQEPATVPTTTTSSTTPPTTENPTGKPTASPTGLPTAAPTSTPTANPTAAPTATPGALANWFNDLLPQENAGAGAPPPAPTPAPLAPAPTPSPAALAPAAAAPPSSPTPPSPTPSPTTAAPTPPNDRGPFLLHFSYQDGYNWDEDNIRWFEKMTSEGYVGAYCLACTGIGPDRGSNLFGWGWDGSIYDYFDEYEDNIDYSCTEGDTTWIAPCAAIDDGLGTYDPKQSWTVRDVAVLVGGEPVSPDYTSGVVPVQIRNSETGLCLTEDESEANCGEGAYPDRCLTVKPCGGALESRQLFVLNYNNTDDDGDDMSMFEIHPYVSLLMREDGTKCLSSLHHPKPFETAYFADCDDTRYDDTTFWWLEPYSNSS